MEYNINPEGYTTESGINFKVGSIYGLTPDEGNITFNSRYNGWCIVNSDQSLHFTSRYGDFTVAVRYLEYYEITQVK